MFGPFLLTSASVPCAISVFRVKAIARHVCEATLKQDFDALPMEQCQELWRRVEEKKRMVSKDRPFKLTWPPGSGQELQIPLLELIRGKQAKIADNMLRRRNGILKAALAPIRKMIRQAFQHENGRPDQVVLFGGNARAVMDQVVTDMVKSPERDTPRSCNDHAYQAIARGASLLAAGGPYDLTEVQACRIGIWRQPASSGDEPGGAAAAAARSVQFCPGGDPQLLVFEPFCDRYTQRPFKKTIQMGLPTWGGEATGTSGDPGIMVIKVSEEILREGRDPEYSEYAVLRFPVEHPGATMRLTLEVDVSGVASVKALVLGHGPLPHIEATYPWKLEERDEDAWARKLQALMPEQCKNKQEADVVVIDGSESDYDYDEDDDGV